MLDGSTGEGCRAALSDVGFAIEDMIAEGDRVVVRGTFTAIHDRGEWLGLAPTGNRVTTTTIAIFRVEEGKIAELWTEGTLEESEEGPSST